jgi:hypothetical protein
LAGIGTKKFSPPRPNDREGLMFPPEQSSKDVRSMPQVKKVATDFLTIFNIGANGVGFGLRLVPLLFNRVRFAPIPPLRAEEQWISYATQVGDGKNPCAK